MMQKISGLVLILNSIEINEIGDNCSKQSQPRNRSAASEIGEWNDVPIFFNQWKEAKLIGDYIEKNQQNVDRIEKIKIENKKILEYTVSIHLLGINIVNNEQY